MKALTLLAALTLLTAQAWGQNQFEMNQQAAEDFKKADARLNQVYKQLTAKLDKNVKANLVNAQVLWIKFRDAAADAKASEFQGGTMYPCIYEGERAHLTEQRTHDLEQWLKEYDQR